MSESLGEPVLQLDQIQGHIIPGFKKDHQHFVFARITDPNNAKRYLRSLQGRVSTAAEVFPAHALWKAMKLKQAREPANLQFVFLNIAISASGLRQLKSPSEVDMFNDAAFKLGMSERSELIGDPANDSDDGHRAKWVVGGPNHPVDLVFILASDDLAWLTEERLSLEAGLNKNGMLVVHRALGRVRTGSMSGHEHFGFKDGISEPVTRGRRSSAPADYVYARQWPADLEFDALRISFAAPGKPLIWPGHFLFGYPRQRRDQPLEPNPLDVPVGPDWASNGSFMVFRRLQQRVSEFEAFLDSVLNVMRQSNPDTLLNRDQVGAMLVGRWKSGTPLARCPVTDCGLVGDPANYFQFAQDSDIALPNDDAPLSQSDPSGNRCPLAAHIRKVNPRDQQTDLGPGVRTLQRLLMRRGIPYGPSVAETPLAGETEDRGLLFVAFQSSIIDQFEFLTQNWVNQKNRPLSDVGRDAILAQASDALTVKLPVGHNTVDFNVPGGWVVPTGGEYFFCPPIDFFRTLLQF